MKQKFVLSLNEKMIIAAIIGMVLAIIAANLILYLTGTERKIETFLVGILGYLFIIPAMSIIAFDKTSKNYWKRVLLYYAFSICVAVAVFIIGIKVYNVGEAVKLRSKSVIAIFFGMSLSSALFADVAERIMKRQSNKKPVNEPENIYNIESKNMYICPACGHKSTVTTKYCGGCGAKFDE